MYVKTGSYVGTGSARSVSGVGFRPRMVIVRRDNATNPAVIRIDSMAATNSKFITGPNGLSTTLITSCDSDGFSLGSGDAAVNQTSTTYMYLAIGGEGSDFAYGTYTGNGSDNRDITAPGFNPDLVIVIPEAAVRGPWRSSDFSGDSSMNFTQGAGANMIQGFVTGGFQIGTNSSVNSNTAIYHWVAFKKVSGVFNTFTYSGNSTDDRDITGFGFQPTFALTQRTSGVAGLLRNAAVHSGDQSIPIDGSASNAANKIQSFLSDGIQVGTDASVNTTGGTYFGFAFKDAAAAAAQDFTADASVVEWTSPQAAASYPQLFANLPNVTEWVMPSALLVRPQSFDDTPLITEWLLPPALADFAPSGAGRDFAASPSIIEWSQPTAQAKRFNTQHLPQGQSGLLIYGPDFEPIAGVEGPIGVLNWKTSRKENALTTWQATIPIDDQLVDGVPLHRAIKTGWHVCLIQDGNHPLNELDKDYLLYMGKVMFRKYDRGEDNGPTLTLSGLSRNTHLVERSTHRGLSFSGQDVGEIAETLIDDETIIGPNAGVELPDNYADIQPTVRYADQARYAALLRTGELARYALRESWDFDKPSFRRIDVPPDNGLRLVKVEANDPDLRFYAADGLGAIMAGAPSVGYDGMQVVNRIIPYGSDTRDTGAMINFVRNYYVSAGYGDPQEDGGANILDYLQGNPDWSDTTALTPPTIKGIIATYGEPDLEAFDRLTLQHATATGPYEVQSGTNPDGSTYYYIEDAESIERYGLSEVELFRTDVKNPSDNSGTRAAAADVLYAIAAGELLRRKSEVIAIEAPVANGADTWALPGDVVRFDYADWVKARPGSPIEGENLVWLDENRRMLVSQRDDESDESGIRKVTLTLTAPEIEMTIPDLPEAIILPPYKSPFDNNFPDNNPPDLPDFPTSPDCCDEPNTDVEDGAEPVPETVGEVIPPVVDLKAVLSFACWAAWDRPATVASPYSLLGDETDDWASQTIAAAAEVISGSGASCSVIGGDYQTGANGNSFELALTPTMPGSLLIIGVLSLPDGGTLGAQPTIAGWTKLLSYSRPGDNFGISVFAKANDGATSAATIDYDGNDQEGITAIALEYVNSANNSDPVIATATDPGPASSGLTDALDIEFGDAHDAHWTMDASIIYPSFGVALKLR